MSVDKEHPADPICGADPIRGADRPTPTAAHTGRNRPQAAGAAATPADETQTHIAASHSGFNSARAFQRDLYFYWSTVRAHPLSLTKQGRLYKKDLRRVNAALLQPEDLGPGNELEIPRLIFIRLLLTDLGLLEPSDRTIHAVDPRRPSSAREPQQLLPPRKRMKPGGGPQQPPEAWPAPHPCGPQVGAAWFLAQKPTERILRTFAHWRDGTFWNEMLSIPNTTIIGAGSRLDPAPTQIVHARNKVLEHIRVAQPRLGKLVCTGVGPPTPPHDDRKTTEWGHHDATARWTPIHRLIDHIRTTDYDFLLPRDYTPFQLRYYRKPTPRPSPRRSPYISYGNEMGWSFTPPFSDEAEGWQVIEAGFICAILLEPLHWMGLLDIGYRQTRLHTMRTGTLASAAYRLTPVGAWVLGVGRPHAVGLDIPEGEGRVVVQPNFELFALDPISDLTLAKLDEFAERMQGNQGLHAIKYRLTRESVYRAQKNGWTAAHIIDTLNDISRRALRKPTAVGPPSPLRSPRSGAAGEASGDRTESLSDPRRTEHDPLPQNVVRTLQEWQNLHQRITIHRQANLLQAVDDALLDQLMRNPAISSHLTTHVGETAASLRGLQDVTPGTALALIPPTLGETEELVYALQQAGYPPMRTRSQQDATRPSFTIALEAPETPSPPQAGGTEREILEVRPHGWTPQPHGVGATVGRMAIHFDVALPSFYVFEQIAPFTNCIPNLVREAWGREPGSPDRYFITPSAIQDAVERGISVDEILDRLRTLHSGPLPHWVEVKIRAWGHYYGHATVQTVTLVQIQDERTLNQLLSEPELKAILHPIAPDATKALALVHAKDLDSLYQILAEYGITIQNP